jgi:hypothetical protein
MIKRCDIRDLGDLIAALEDWGGNENPALYARNTLADFSTCMWFRCGSQFLMFQKVGKGIYSAHIVGHSNTLKEAKEFIHTVGKHMFSTTDCESIWCLIDKDNKRLQRLCGLLRFKRVAEFPSREIFVYEFQKSQRTEEEGGLCHQ